MKPVIFLRVASGLTLLHAVLHTMGGVFGKPAPGLAAATEAVMRANYFPVLGVTRSYWEFYRGMGLGVTIFLTAEGLVFWMLGALAHFDKAQAVAKAVRKALGVPGIMLAQLNGAGAGQSVFHVHFHIIPRQAGVDMVLHARDMVDAKKLEPIAAKIRSALP